MNGTLTQNNYTSDEYKTTSISLRDLLWVLFKHKWKILLVFLAIIIPSVNIALKQPQIYETSAKILVKEGRENTTPPTAVEAPNIILNTTRPEDINSEIEILRSRLLSEKIVEKLGVDLKKSKDKSDDKIKDVSPSLDSLRKIIYELKNLLRNLLTYFFPFFKTSKLSPPSPFESAVLRVQRGLNVRQIPTSNVIQVIFGDLEPVVTVDVINTLLDFYLDHHLMVHKTPGAYQFFSEQAIQHKKLLEDSEQKLEEFKKKWSVAELNLQRELLIRQIGYYENDLKKTESDFYELRERLTQQTEQLENQKEKVWVSETSQRNPMLSQLTSQLSQLKLEEKKLIDKYTDPNHRNIQGIHHEIKEIEMQLEEWKSPVQSQIVTGINSIFQSLQQSILNNKAEIKAIEIKKANIKKQLTETKEKLDHIDEREMELNQLVRQIKINEENYQLYRKKVEENRISEAMDLARFANISIIEPAMMPIEPLPTQKRFKIFMAILLGITAGLGTAFLCELLDHSVGNAEELESSLDVPVLGSIPDIKKQ